MKKLILLIIIALTATIVNAQTPNWAWAKSAVGSGFDAANSITIDVSGNVYVTGVYILSSFLLYAL